MPLAIVSRNNVAFSLIAWAKINERPSGRQRRGVTIMRANSPDFFRLGFFTGLLLVHYTSRSTKMRCKCVCVSIYVYVCVCMCVGSKHGARAGQVSLKNRVAIPVSTWRKMKRAFHAPTLFSRFLVINSSASHYGAFPRERTQHKLQIPTAGFRYGRLQSVFIKSTPR